MSSTAKLQHFLNSPGRTFFALWVPVLFSMIAEPLTGLIDTAFVARLGSESLAALGVGTVVMSSGLWLFNFLSVGSQTEVSQASGRKDLGGGRRISSLALLLAAVIGLVLAALIIVSASFLASLMGAEGSVHDHAVSYIRIRSFGGPAVLLTMTGFGILYGLADMRSPLLIAVTVNLLNIIFDWILIFGLGPIPPLGIAGAAIATTFSQWVGGIWSLYLVYRKIGFTRKIDVTDVIKLLSIGRDMLVRTGSLILFLLLATRSATRIGAEAGAAHQAVRQVWVFSCLFLDASAVTAQSLIGYYLGSGKIIDARRVARLVFQWSLFIGVVLMVVMLCSSAVVGRALVPLDSIMIFYPAWAVSAFLQPVAAIAFVTDGIHWGTGDFRFLRNVVVLATVCGASGILIADFFKFAGLTYIWWITGLWILIRACFGVVRIWPGMKKSPLAKTVAPG